MTSAVRHRARPRQTVGLVVALAGCFTALACVVSTERPWPTVRRLPPPAQGRPAPPPPAPPPPRAPPSDAPPPDPEAAQIFLQGLGQPAQPLVVLTTPPAVTLMGLENTARSELVGGGSADGDVAAATLDAGQRATMAVTIATDRCTFFVAHGGLGVIELDLFLAPAGSPQTILRQDEAAGPIAVLGGRGQCLKAPEVAATSELHVQVRRGRGLVLVRMYRRGP